MRELMRGILEAGPLGWILLASNALAGLAALVLVARSINPRPRRPLRTLSRTLGAACAGLAVAASITAVLFLRARDLILPPGEPPLSLYRATGPEVRKLGDMISQAEMALSLTAYATLGIAALVFLAALLAHIASRHKLRARRRLAFTAAIAGAGLAGSIAIGALGRTREVNLYSHCDAECRRAIVADASGVLADARLHVALAAAVAFFLLRRAVRRAADAGHAPLGPRARAVSMAVFGLGVVAFAGSRAMAFDARHPPPAQNPNEICPDSSVDERSLPPAGAARKLAEGPILKLSAELADLNGSRVDNPEDLAKSMAVLRRLYIGRPKHPVLIAAPASEPLSALAPWLRILAREGFPNAQILVAHPPDLADTETLGRIQRAPRCASVPVKLEQIEQAIARGATWGELADSLPHR
ncbi:MAG TPA: hypothetical protein VK459_15730 [Polyangiaceae bacterium]|nr:hypothetical protein [Polyangiaceae bacterium]